MIQNAKIAIPLLTRIVSAASLILVACSCSHPSIDLASVDIKSSKGDSLHCSIRVSTNSLQPLGYVIDVKNTGTKTVSFRPGYPDTTMVFEPDRYEADIFSESAQNSGQSKDPIPVLELEPGHTCTLQLQIALRDSDLRGDIHTCQVVITPADAQQGIVLRANPNDDGKLRSNRFKISVP